MPKLTITKGLPGSGKTTWAKSECLKNGNLYRVNRDSLRGMLLGGRQWSGKQEKLVRYIQSLQVFHLLDEGFDVVVDDTNLLGGGVDTWKQWVRDSPMFGNAFYNDAGEDNTPIKRPKVEVKDFTEVPISTCIRNDAARGTHADGMVGAGVIYRMALDSKLLDLSKIEKCAIIDMDGTLADCTHRLPFIQQQPKNYQQFYWKVALDPIIRTISAAVWQLAYLKFEIIICSGRPTRLSENPNINPGAATWDWLRRHNIPASYLFMRNSGDYRPDSEVKEGILQRMYEAGLKKEAIQLCIDDRDAIVKVWERNGLPTLQVLNGSVIHSANGGLLKHIQLHLDIPIRFDLYDTRPTF